MLLNISIFAGVTASERGPPPQKINFEPYTEDDRLKNEKNHSEKIINTSPLNDSRGQEQEIMVCTSDIYKHSNIYAWVNAFRLFLNSGV